MIDLVKEFVKHQKRIGDYVKKRVSAHNSSECKSRLKKRIETLNASWDMSVSAAASGNRQNFLSKMSYGLVKQQQLTRRAIFSNNFRADPLFSFRAIGNTPEGNAINMQDIVQSNNEQIHFRQKVLMPGNHSVAKTGIAVVFTEYCNNKENGWRTVADPVYGTRRVYGPIKNTHNAMCTLINPLNYFQDHNAVESDDASFRGHIERWKVSTLVNKYRAQQGLYIKENIETVIRASLKSNNITEFYHNPLENKGFSDIDEHMVDVIRGQFQIHIDGNEDDSTYYYVEMVGDTIIRFQDNPYDMNMNLYTVITCERRDEFYWGNTPAEYSLQNERNMNLLLNASLDNVLESMKRYILYNKNGVSPDAWMMHAYNGKIPVDVSTDINLGNLFFTYQVPDSAGPAITDAYARILENDQRFSSTPDLNRKPSDGGPSNKTATAANIMANAGNVQDADILERLSYTWQSVGEKESIIMAQFLGNFSPILIKPTQREAMRMVRKENITGNYQVSVETALQQSYQGELMRYQNIITWLQNLTNGGAQINANIIPLVRQVLKMGKFLHIDEALPEEQAMQQQGFVPTAPMPGMETAGAAQEAMVA